MKYYLTLLTVLTFVWISVACDCLMTPIENHIRDTKFIIVGQVVELIDKKEEEHYFQKFDSTRSYQVNVRILNNYKGPLKKGQIIELGSEFSNCSFYFDEGKKYLLFLTKDKKTGKYFQKPCSYSEKFENALSSIKIIEKQTK